METENVIYVYNEKGLNDTLLCIAQKQDESKIIETTTCKKKNFFMAL